METVNRFKIIKAAHGELLRRDMAGMSNRTLQHAVAALADGYLREQCRRLLKERRHG